MGIEFNIFKHEGNILSIALEWSSKILRPIFLRPYWIFVGAIIFDVLANKKNISVKQPAKGNKEC
jgi:hypothetical protein